VELPLSFKDWLVGMKPTNDWFENVFGAAANSANRHLARVTISHGIRAVTLISAIGDAELEPISEVNRSSSYRLVVAGVNPTHRDVDIVGDAHCRDGSVEFVGRPTCRVPLIGSGMPIAQRNGFIFQVSNDPAFIEANVITDVSMDHPLQGRIKVKTSRVQNVAAVAVGTAMKEVSEIRGNVDVAFLTIKEEEYVEALRHFQISGFARGKNGLYALAELTSTSGDVLRVAFGRAVEQGPVKAGGTARDMIEDLQPSVMFLVGIAGTVPNDELCLGDVVLATRVHDFSVSAALPGGKREFTNQGGPMHRRIRDLLAQLPALESTLEGWERAPLLLREKPSVHLDESALYGPEDWKRKVKAAVEHHFPVGVEGCTLASDISQYEFILTNSMPACTSFETITSTPALRLSQ